MRLGGGGGQWVNADSGVKAEVIPGWNALYAVGYANGAGAGIKAEAIPGWNGDVRHPGRPGRRRGRPGAMAGGQVGGNPVAAMPAGVDAVNEVHEILR